MVGLDGLHDQLARNFYTMREIDWKTKKVVSNIDSLADDYMSKVKKYSADKIKGIISNIQQQFDEAKGYSDDKVQLSIQTYELVNFNFICLLHIFNKFNYQVDEHIRKLDSDIAHLRAKMDNRPINAMEIVKGGSQERKYYVTGR